MKRLAFFATVFLATILRSFSQTYNPAPANIKAREVFSAEKFGIFLHWGIYSTFAQGEWYLHTGNLNKDEYAKAARGFYPIRFNADDWAEAIKDAGAKYVTFTSRHHDGFSMFHTAQSKYNIVDATPFHRDVLGELVAACRKKGLNFHIYYSLLDWTREDFPVGGSGRNTGRSGKRQDYESYLAFMKAQLKELLSNYGPIGAIWFDGWWDNPKMDWKLPEIYAAIHQIQPACLVGNNHHVKPFPGEDFQMFEKDLPGQNTAGFNKNAVISPLPLEMCETMNGMWGYKVADQNYKSGAQIVQLLVRAAAKGSNLLLNIGPQPDGELPETALQRLKETGQWTRQFGASLYGTSPTGLAEQAWGVTTMKDNHIYLHVFKADSTNLITLPIKQKVKKVVSLKSGKPLPFKWNGKAGLSVCISTEYEATMPDFVIDATVNPASR